MHACLRDMNIYTWNNMLECRDWKSRQNPPYRSAILVMDEAGGCCSRTRNIGAQGLVSVGAWGVVTRTSPWELGR